MAYTEISDIVNPEVLADQISAKFPDKLVLGNSNLVQVDSTFPLGSPGTILTVPFWKRMGSFAALTEGTAMTPGKIQTGVEKTVVLRAGMAIEVLDTAALVSKADPVGEISDQISRRAAEYIDAKLITIASATPNTLDYTSSGTGGKMDQNTIVQGLLELGDNMGALQAGGRIFMHSKPFADLMQLGVIQNQYQSGMDFMKTGLVPTLLGLPIEVSDRVTTAVESSVTKYYTYIIGPESLGLFYQRQVQVEFDRDILLLADIIAANVHFAPHLFGWDENSGTQKAEDAKSIHVVSIKSN